MTGKYGKMSKVDLVKRLAAMEEDLRAQMDMQEILQDLHVHQEEVRVQNEQLIEMKRSLERSRDRYADLYDFAPIAYLTMDGNGVVLDINITGTVLLAVERNRIVGSPFFFYVDEVDRPAFFQRDQTGRAGWAEIYRPASESAVAGGGQWEHVQFPHGHHRHERMETGRGGEARAGDEGAECPRCGGGQGSVHGDFVS